MWQRPHKVGAPLSLIFYHGQLDGKLRALAVFALHLDVAIVQVDHLLHVGQTEAESLHVVHIARMNAVELIENLLQILFLHAHTRVFQ